MKTAGDEDQPATAVYLVHLSVINSMLSASGQRSFPGAQEMGDHELETEHR